GLDYGDRKKEHLRHDLCLYVLETLPEIEGAAALIVLLEDLLQARSIYHTIRHRVMSRPGQFSTPNGYDWMWNLPYTYWPCDAEQLADVREWIRELQGKPLHFRKATRLLWDRMQIVMGYLQGGKTYEEAQRASKRPWDF